MNDPVPLVPVVLAAPPVSPALPSYAVLAKRCRRLQITADALASCRTFGELQVLVKQQYRVLALRFHPDRRALRLKGIQSPGRPLTGDTFRMITKIYQWLMALPKHALVPRPRPLALWYATPPIYDACWPSALERKPLCLPFGWQEDTSVAWYR